MRTWISLGCAAAVLALAAPAAALIDPKFTPLVLLDQSEIVIQLSVKPADAPGTLTATVVKYYKGKDKVPRGELTIDLSNGPEELAKQVLDAAAAQPDQPALLFAGTYEGLLESGGGRMVKAYLHITDEWIDLTKTGGKEATGYQSTGDDAKMNPTFHGGTELFIRGIEYALTDPSPDFPVAAGTEWDSQTKAAKVVGKVYSATPVDLDANPGKLAPYLHVGAEQGDRLFQYDPAAKALKDVTAARKLAARSAACAWGDFNQDGRLDLASWDGKALTLHLLAADGTFGARPVDVGTALRNGCIGLAATDCGRKGRPGLLASTPDWPVLLMPNEDGSYAAKPLGAGEFVGKGLGPAVACLVADLDDDLVGDVLQMCAKGSLLYKGKGNGEFEKPTPLRIAHGPGKSAPCLGDFDADGLLDVFVAAEDRCRIWQNRGGLKFEETLSSSGEPAYIARSGGIGGQVCDFNSDGRQDILILYGDMGPQLFFNRGFRSFGHAQPLAPTAQSLEVDDISQQAGCMLDLNGDGVQDMALVLGSGDVWLFIGAVVQAQSLGVLVSLAPDGGYAGPVKVAGYHDKRCLGAWNVVAGQFDAFVAQRDPGVVRLTWQFPNGKPQEKEFTLEAKPVKFLLKP